MSRQSRHGCRRLRAERGRSRLAAGFLGGLLSAAALVPAAQAQDVLGIAAIVNDEVISVFDLEARIKFTVESSGLPDTLETRTRLKDQVLRGLIDERLRLQEAKRLNIRVTERDLAGAIASIEKQNNVPAGGLDVFLAERGVESFTLEAQIRSTIAWQKLVYRKIRPRVEIGDDEVEEALARMQANKGTPLMKVAEIFISVDSPEQEDEVLQLAHRLIEQLRGGARFAALARQFSQSASAAVGGDLGWVQQGQLDEALDKALKKMKPGSISPPIRSFGGYHILLLSSRRDPLAAPLTETKVKLSQIALALEKDASEADVTAQMSLANTIATTAVGCDDFNRLAKMSGGAMSGGLGEVKVGDLPPELAEVVLGLDINQVSKPIRTEAGLLLFMLCAREDPPSKLPSPEEVKRQLMQQRIELLARRYMRDLRNQAFVDLRV
ncbi:MAG: peptidylprolyl isomerase [Kiloniellales bacterium]